MVVVPAFSISDDTDPPAVGGKVVFQGDCFVAEIMGGAVDEPGAVVNRDNAQKNAPDHPGNPADGKKDETESELNFYEVVIQEAVKLVIRKILGVIEEDFLIIKLREGV